MAAVSVAHMALGSVYGTEQAMGAARKVCGMAAQCPPAYATSRTGLFISERCATSGTAMAPASSEFFAPFFLAMEMQGAKRGKTRSRSDGVRVPGSISFPPDQRGQSRACAVSQSTVHQVESLCMSQQGYGGASQRSALHVRFNRQSRTSAKLSTRANATTEGGGSKAIEDQLSKAESIQIQEEADRLVKPLKGSSIYLIGMMGSGKSTIAPILANALGYHCFDTDSLVEEAAGGVRVAEIISKNGIEEFRDVESEVLKQLAPVTRCIISTGGGAVMRKSNWSYLRNGVVIFLHVPLDILADRTTKAGLSSRPLLSKPIGVGEDPKVQAFAALIEIFDERKAMFEMADATVSISDLAGKAGIEAEAVTTGMISLQVLRELSRLVNDPKKMGR